MLPLANHSDEQLILLVGQDNEQAFNEIYDRFWDSLFSKAYNFLRREEAAKDCVQEVFIWLWQHRYTVKIENVNNYLHQAVRFQTFKVLKEQKTLISLDERLTEFTGMILKDESHQYRELKEIIVNMLSLLPADQQEIFKLNREQGLTYKEIAEQKNISVKTVEKKMSLALKMLKQQRPGLDEVILMFLLSDTIP